MNDSLQRLYQEVWGLLKRASVDKKHPMRFCVLASQGKQSPVQRYVVLRKIDEQDRLVFFTDGRSAKVQELAQNPFASALFYHTGQRIQVRVEGKVSLHKQNEVSEHYRPMVQGEAWKAYGSKLAPGMHIDLPEEAYEWSKRLAQTHFTVISLELTSLEVLQLNGLTHQRASFHRYDHEWQGQWLVP